MTNVAASFIEIESSIISVTHGTQFVNTRYQILVAKLLSQKQFENELNFDSFHFLLSNFTKVQNKKLLLTFYV